MKSIIIAVIVVAIILAIAVASIKSRLEWRREQQAEAAVAQEKARQKAQADAEKLATFTDLLEQAEAGDVVAYNAIDRTTWWQWLNQRPDSAELLSRRDTLVREVNLWAGCVKATDELSERQAQIAATTAGALNFTARASCLTWWKYVNKPVRQALGNEFFDPDTFQAELERDIAAFVASRFATAQTATPTAGPAFLEIYVLLLGFGRAGGSCREALRHVGIRELSQPDPAVWNRLVAQFIAKPTADDFRMATERLVGDISYQVAEAIRTDNFTAAKMAWAYCNHNPEARAELGDVLWADLVRYIEFWDAGARDRLKQAAQQ